MIRALWLISGVALVLALGCRDKRDETQTGEYAKTVPEVPPRTDQPTMDQPTMDQPTVDQPTVDITADRETYLGSMQQRLDEMDRRIQELKSSTGARAEALEQELREDRQALNQALENAKQATAENWTDAKQKVNETFGRLQTAYERAKTAFEKEGTGTENAP